MKLQSTFMVYGEWAWPLNLIWKERSTCHRPNSKAKLKGMESGASKVKWVALDPCLVLSESDLILCTNLKNFEEKDHRYFKNIFIYKAKQLMMTNKNTRKVYMF